MLPIGTEELASRVLKGAPRGVARALSMVENGHPRSGALLDALFDASSSSALVGITGPPGAGKSTLVDGLIRHWRSAGRKVGVIAVDPTSPFTGGAVLGDRLRMQDHAADPGVFIRSMGSRGHLGGLSGATRDAAQVLAAASYDPVILETVGVGQAEVEVASLADVTVLVLVPGLGDDVQAMKAGIMEIGDMIVLNKADRPGIDQLESAVRASLEMIPAGRPVPSVVRCSATTGEGMDILAAELDALVAAIPEGDHRRADRVRELIEGVIREKGAALAEMLIVKEFGSMDGAVGSVLSGETTPYRMGSMLEGMLERKNEC